MEIFDTVPELKGEESELKQAAPDSFESPGTRIYFKVYALALVAAISVWFIAVRAPLWLDETVSYSQISAGFHQIISRQGGLSAPAYSYLLWFATKIIGTSEIALRIPSILAMLAAVYLLYRAAREFFDWDVTIITAIVFCIHPVVIFASIDVRPYAFGALAISSAIYLLVRLRHSDSNLLAAMFGIATGVITYFQLLFGALFPALAICFLVFGFRGRKTFWRQLGVALGAFFLTFIPVVAGLLYIARTSGNHVFDEPPHLADLGWTLAPGWIIYILLGTAVVAAVTRKIDLSSRMDGWRILLCVSLALVPILILYSVSLATPLHIFVPRYRLVAIPGIALCWGLIVSRIDSRLIRLLFCVAVVSATAYQYYSSPLSFHHGYTWKYALELAEKSASPDNAPVLICSDLPEADHTPMPVGAAVKDSALFAPLSYYKLSGPVVGMPRTLDEQARAVGLAFVQHAAWQQQRFLALGSVASYDSLHWLIHLASVTHDVRVLGQPEGVVVLEFTPRTVVSGPH